MTMLTDNWGVYEDNHGCLVFAHYTNGVPTPFLKFQHDYDSGVKKVLKLVGFDFLQFERPADGAPNLIEWDDSVRNRKYSLGLTNGALVYRDITNRSSVTLVADAVPLRGAVIHDGVDVSSLLRRR